MARWLGYIPFDQIIDQRNAPPVVENLLTSRSRKPYITVGIDVELPDADDITPKIDIADFRGIQPYKLVMLGEKSSLHDVLARSPKRSAPTCIFRPATQRHDDLPDGSSAPRTPGRWSAVFRRLRPVGLEHGRSSSPASCRRSRSLHFPDLDFEVHRAALTPTRSASSTCHRHR